MPSVQQVEACTSADKVEPTSIDSTFSFVSHGINALLGLMLPVYASEADTYAPMVAVIHLDTDCV